MLFGPEDPDDVIEDGLGNFEDMIDEEVDRNDDEEPSDDGDAS